MREQDQGLDPIHQNQDDRDVIGPRTGSGGVGKVPVTARLTPPSTTSITNIFRVADLEAAQELAIVMSGRATQVQRSAAGEVAATAPPVSVPVFEGCLGTDLCGSADYGPRDGNGVAAGAEAAVDRAAASAGAPLPAELKERYEASLGADLSNVRVHTGGASAEAASAVGARAYTVGDDIHFGRGHFDPTSSDGIHLLAHEVAHTVQQRGAAPVRQNKLEVSAPADAAEHEADRAADAMIRGEPARVSCAASLARQIVQRDPGTLEHPPPPPPGMVTLKNLSPVAAAVKAGESGGGGSIPSGAGLADAAQRNFNAMAQHCTNVQAHYHAKAMANRQPFGPEDGDHNMASFANTAGKANKFCLTGAVNAGVASSTISGWTPQLQSSQDTWDQAKEAAEAIQVDTIASDNGTTRLDGEALDEEGKILEGTVKNTISRDLPPTPADATPANKADQEKQRAQNDLDVASGKRVKKESKVLLDEATTNFEQSVTAMTQARSGVVTAHKGATGALLAAKVAANGKRQQASEDDKKAIEDILKLVDTAQSAIDRSQGIIKDADSLKLLTDQGDAALKTKASDVARLVLTLDGTIPTIEGEIAACKTTNANLKGVIDDKAIEAAGKAYKDALVAFKAALKVLPDRIKKYEQAHAAFAESVNLALQQQGLLKPGAPGVKPQMAALAKLRVASAATSAAVAATADVLAEVTTLAGSSDAPQPDICQMSKMVAAHQKMFSSAPGHIKTIQGILTAREASLKAYVKKLEF